MATSQLIKLNVLREMREGGSLRSAAIVGQKGGFVVEVRSGMADRILAAKTGVPRLFATLDTAAGIMRELGIVNFNVDLSGFEPGRARGARPDRGAAMREVHSAAKHDVWFRQQVSDALAKDAKGTATWHSHEDVFAELETD
jgi:hypothetical protein